MALADKDIRISVVIPAYNRKEELKNCLESLFRQKHSKDKFEIIVVDDGSTDGTEEYIAQIKGNSKPNVVYLKQKNQGAAVARNTGVKNSRGDYVAFIDSDCVASEDWLTSCISLLSTSDQHIAGVGGKIIPGFTNLVGKGSHLLEFHQYLSEKEKSVRVVPTANLCIRKKVLDEVGYFDNELRTSQDTELCWRIIKRGYKIIYSPEIVVTHYGINSLRELRKKEIALGRGFVATRKKHKDLPPVRIPDNIYFFALMLPVLYVGSVLKILSVSSFRFAGIKLPLIFFVILYGRFAFWWGALKAFNNL